MSYGYRARVRETQFIWDGMTDEEKNSLMDYCPLSDELIKEAYPDATNMDAVIDKMSNAEFVSFHRKVLARWRKKKAAKYLRENGREAQADEIEKELEQELVV